jgi:AmmeMemoRadiSam system protein A
MTTDQLSPEERSILLKLARQALEEAICIGEFQPLDLNAYPERLRQPGASFVTLTRKGELRGCIGALEPILPLVEDVCEHAASAALRDYRFLPVMPEELPEIEIEISILTVPRLLAYNCPEDLLAILRPGVDGVILRDGYHRATFLPQVWEKLPDPAYFLSYLCQKLGREPDLWQLKKLQIFTYEVEEIRE